MTRTAEQTLALVQTIFNENLPFNQFVGLHVTQYDPNGVEVCIEMRPELVGNAAYKILHGGVTATLLDVAGGLTCFAGVIARYPEAEDDFILERLKSLSTIDMRVDYLRPGRGERFIATGQIIRTGNKVAVCRMELHNEKNEHIAFGTGTYMVG